MDKIKHDSGNEEQSEKGIDELLLRYVVEEEDTDPGDDALDLPGLVEEPMDVDEIDVENSGDNGNNGDSRIDPESNKHEISYMGHYRTTTGIVEIMRQNGNQEAADLLEELRLTKNAAQQLLDNLKDLHRKKTGTYPSTANLRKMAHRREP